MIGTTFSEAEMAIQIGPEARDTPNASIATTSGWMLPTWTRLSSQGVMIIASANAAAVRRLDQRDQHRDRSSGQPSGPEPLHDRSIEVGERHPQPGEPRRVAKDRIAIRVDAHRVQRLALSEAQRRLPVSLHVLEPPVTRSRDQRHANDGGAEDERDEQALGHAPPVCRFTLTAGADSGPQSAAMLHVLVLAGLSALLLSPGLLSGPSLDAAVFMQVAERMRDGATLYVGIWDHKPPGIYLVLVAGQSVLPFLSAWQVSWLLSVAATAGTGLVVQTICRGLGTSRGASPSSPARSAWS